MYSLPLEREIRLDPAAGRLLKPHIRYYDSFFEAFQEYTLLGEDPGAVQAHVRDEESFGRYVDFLVTAQWGAPPNAAVVYWWVVDGQYAGRLLIRHHPADPKVHSEGSIGYSIRPSMRRQGHAKSMLTCGVEKAKDLGVAPTLAIFDTNEASLRTAASAGFVFDHAELDICFFRLPA